MSTDITMKTYVQVVYLVLVHLLFYSMAHLSENQLLNFVSQVSTTTDMMLIAQENDLLASRYSKVLHSKSLVSSYTPTRAKHPFAKNSCVSSSTFDENRPKTILIILNNTKMVFNVLEALRSSIINCTTLIDPGLYSSENTFMFLSTTANMTKILFEKVFEDKEIKRHPKVFGVQHLSADNTIVWRYNIYAEKVEKFPVSLNEANSTYLNDFPMQNFTFQVTTLPYDVYVTGNYHQAPESVRKAIDFDGGVEVTIINEICRQLQCSVEFSNPEDFTWGHGQTSQKNISGFYKDIYEEKAHFAMSLVGPDASRIKIAKVTNHFETVPFIYTLVTPNPRPKSRFWNILKAFSVYVWISLLASMMIFSIILFVIARKEEELLKAKLSKLSFYPASVWYSFAAICQEHVPESSNGRYANAIRMACAAWLLCIFVITASFSGSLRAFLITPAMEDVIETYEQLVKSSLTWNIVLFGEPIEEGMATHKDQYRQKFWKDKQVVEYQVFPYERMKDVYLHKSAMMEYGQIIDTTIQTAFTLPNGNKLVHVSKAADLAVSWYTSWPFHPLNPWFDRINRYVESMVETGLKEHIEANTRFELKQKYLTDLLAQGEVTPVMIEINKLDHGFRNTEMDDLIGVFSLLLAMCITSSIIFALEVLLSLLRAKCNIYNIISFTGMFN